VTWNSGVAPEDLGNCLARITLNTQGTFTVKALLANPWGGTVTYPLIVEVGRPPTVVSPSIEGIVVQSASHGVLTNGGAFVGDDALTLTMRYLNAAQAATPVTYTWSYRMDSEPWVALPPGIGRAAADVSSRKFSYSGYKNNHTFTFRCIVTTTAGGVTVTTRTVSLTYIGTPA